MLGLRVEEGASGLVWKRDGQLPTLSADCVTRHQLHSWIGKLLSHYPVVGWLHTACGFLQHCTACKEIAWDQLVSTETCAKAADLLVLLCDKGDPAHRFWAVDPRQRAILWADASSLALGIALEVDGAIIEDATWLHKTEDKAHINMSELDAVIHSVNLCVKWGVRWLTIKIDSATAHRWLKSIFEKLIA